jgi:hypothetical protein
MIAGSIGHPAFSARRRAIFGVGIGRPAQDPLEQKTARGRVHVPAFSAAECDAPRRKLTGFALGRPEQVAKPRPCGN